MTDEERQTLADLVAAVETLKARVSHLESVLEENDISSSWAKVPC